MAIEFDLPLEHEASGTEVGYMRITHISINNESETVKVMAKIWRSKARFQNNKRFHTEEFDFSGDDYQAIAHNGNQKVHKSVEDVIMALPEWAGGNQIGGV